MLQERSHIIEGSFVEWCTGACLSVRVNCLHTVFCWCGRSNCWDYWSQNNLQCYLSIHSCLRYIKILWSKAVTLFQKPFLSEFGDFWHDCWSLDGPYLWLCVFLHCYVLWRVLVGLCLPVQRLLCFQDKPRAESLRSVDHQSVWLTLSSSVHFLWSAVTTCISGT